MTTNLDPKMVALVVIAIIAILLIIWAVVRQRRRAGLKERYGPEYERIARESGTSKAETTLLERERRVEKFNIRPLPVDERERFVTEWRSVQARFVDDPKAAVNQADQLVDNVMRARGYPMSDFEQRAADISVTHPQVVSNYRAAHQIAIRHQQGNATTEDLRQAMIYYRSLFDDLLEPAPAGPRREVA
ncbi:MAG: hypothetical protein JOZ83_08050 [Silvibacterium sp.]|nr:hypothetical protein [Silvibacterium sp.]